MFGRGAGQLRQFRRMAIFMDLSYRLPIKQLLKTVLKDVLIDDGEDVVIHAILIDKTGKVPTKNKYAFFRETERSIRTPQRLFPHLTKPTSPFL